MGVARWLEASRGAALAALLVVIAAAASADAPALAPPPDDGLPQPGEQVLVDELPEVLTKGEPVYPPEAIAAGVEGTVLVKALVGRDGRVRDTAILRSIPMLDSAAVAAVRRWVFEPPKSNGKPVAAWVAVPVRFALHGRSPEAQALLRASFDRMLGRIRAPDGPGGGEPQRRLRDSVIALARRLDPPPAIPAEAFERLKAGERRMGSSPSASHSSAAERELIEASRLAPWWAEPYRALARLEERENDLPAALRSLRLAAHAVETDGERDALLDKCLALQSRMEAASPR